MIFGTATKIKCYVTFIDSSLTFLFYSSVLLLVQIIYNIMVMNNSWRGPLWTIAPTNSRMILRLRYGIQIYVFNQKILRNSSFALCLWMFLSSNRARTFFVLSPLCCNSLCSANWFATYRPWSWRQFSYLNSNIQVSCRI